MLKAPALARTRARASCEVPEPHARALRGNVRAQNFGKVEISSRDPKWLVFVLKISS